MTIPPQRGLGGGQRIENCFLRCFGSGLEQHIDALFRNHAVFDQVTDGLVHRQRYRRMPGTWEQV